MQHRCFATQWQLQFALMLAWGVSLHLQWVLQNYFSDLIPFFDCLNSSTLHATKKYRRAISEKTLHIDYLKDSIKFIRNLKVFDKNQNVTGRIKCLQGWLVTLNAIILIWAK